MRVILTEDVVGLGDIGETVGVRPGYARNFLIPRGMAIEAASKSAKTIAHKMMQIDAKKRRLKGSAEQLAAQIREVVVELGLRVGAGGRVFGSVGTRDIAKELAAKGFEFDRRRILLDEPIRKVGTHAVSLKLHADVVSEIKVVVSALHATKEEEEAEAEEARIALEAAAAEKAKEPTEEVAATEGEAKVEKKAKKAKKADKAEEPAA